MSFSRRMWRSGSIMMEFVLVLPIYMILLGLLFLWGDMGLKAIYLSFGDRCVAFDGTDRSGRSYDQFSAIEYISDALSAKSSKDYRVDTEVKGSWSAQYAGRTGYEYKIYSWMNGIIGYPLSQYGNNSPGILEVLVNENSEHLDGKGMERVRKYNSYTLRRTELGRNPSVCRNWDAKALLGYAGSKRGWEWSRDEKYADSSAANLESSNSSQDSTPSPKSLGRYKRYSQYDSWTE